MGGVVVTATMDGDLELPKGSVQFGREKGCRLRKVELGLEKLSRGSPWAGMARGKRSSWCWCWWLLADRRASACGVLELSR